MELLIRLTNLPLETEGLIDSLAAVIKPRYEEEHCDSETYVSDIELTAKGSSSPEHIRATARNWNRRLQACLNRAIAKWNSEHQALDNQATYELTKAAMAANNEIHPFGAFALFNMPSESMSDDDADYRFRTILSDTALQDILTHPEQYVICDVSIS